MNVRIMAEDEPLFDPNDDRLRAEVLTVVRMDGTHPVGNYVGMMPVEGEGFKHHIRLDGEQELRHYKFAQIRIWVNKEPTYAIPS